MLRLFLESYYSPLQDLCMLRFMENWVNAASHFRSFRTLRKVGSNRPDSPSRHCARALPAIVRVGHRVQIHADILGKNPAMQALLARALRRGSCKRSTMTDGLHLNLNKLK